MKLESLQPRFEKAQKFALAGSLTILGGLGLVGCGEYTEQQDNDPVETEETHEAGVTHTYLEDGSRVTSYEHDGLSNVLAYCDGPYLVEQTEHFKHYNSGSGNDLTRTLAADICSDGKLTADDFHVQQ